MRTLLVLAALLVLIGLYLLMLRGWRSRARRQAFLPAPAVPRGDADIVEAPVPGLFVGTTFAGRWLDRVVVHRLCDRAAAWLTLRTDGVHIEREGVAALFLPLDAIDDAAPGHALAGKVMGTDGLLILTWRLGDSRLTSAFRATDHAEHARLAEAIRAHLSIPLEAP